jgi:hypothetical protein
MAFFPPNGWCVGSGDVEEAQEIWPAIMLAEAGSETVLKYLPKGLSVLADAGLGLNARDLRKDLKAVFMFYRWC